MTLFLLLFSLHYFLKLFVRDESLFIIIQYTFDNNLLIRKNIDK